MLVFDVRISEVVDIQERKTALTNWLLSKAFQDLTRGMSEALQEAFVYVEVLSLAGQQTTRPEFDMQVADIRHRGNKMKFPDLLCAVAAKLDAPLHFADEYASLQKIRNCLEHRGGVVGQKEADVDKKLKLRFPTHDFLIQYPDGSETLIAEQDGFEVEGPATVVQRIGLMEKEFEVGQRVALTPFEFQRIALGCLAFCEDLRGKLPLHAVGMVLKSGSEK